MLFPGNAAVAEAQGNILAASGDSGAAVEPLRQAYEATPNSEPLFQRYLGALVAAKKLPEARTVVQARLEKNPGNPALKEQLIRLEAGIGGLDAGIAKARAFAMSDRDRSSVYDLVAADLYARNGKPAEAVALLEKSATANPADPTVAVGLARVYAAGGDPGKAEALLSARAKERPDDLAIRRALADVYLLDKKYDNAVAEETRILSQQPSDMVALNNLAWLNQQRGDLGKARELAEKAVAAAPADGARDRNDQGYVRLDSARARRRPGSSAASRGGPRGVAGEPGNSIPRRRCAAARRARIRRARPAGKAAGFGCVLREQAAGGGAVERAEARIKGKIAAPAPGGFPPRHRVARPFGTTWRRFC